MKSFDSFSLLIAQSAEMSFEHHFKTTGVPIAAADKAVAFASACHSLRPSVLTLALVAAFLGSTPPIHADVVTLQVSADTSITSSTPGNNAGAHPWVSAGTDGPFGGEADRRGLLRFDLSSLPAGATITSAVVRLTVVQVPATSPANSMFDLFRLQAEWGEGNKAGNAGAPASAGEATWNSRLHGTATWTVPGAASDAAAVSSGSVMVTAASGAVYSWSGPAILSDVQFWHENPEQNFGWLLKSQGEGTSRTARGFGSKESGSPGRLEIGYTISDEPPPTPSVTITSPTNGASFIAGTPITIEAEAPDAAGSVTNVQFFDGETLLGSDSDRPFSIEATLFVGQHVLTAVAEYDDGQVTNSTAVTITGVTEQIDNPFAERVPKGNIIIELETIADGLAAPLGMGVPDDGSGRLFVYDQNGVVWVISGPGRLSTPLLDIRSRLVSLGAYDERGLLGFAVHPDFSSNALVYTYTSEPYNCPADFENGLGTNNNHQSVIAEWRISEANSNTVDVASRREILRIDQPQSNHNGGAMHFGPDGMLYIVLGDGGAANDTGAGHVAGGNAQDMNRIWGKLLRIDVHGTNSSNGQYGIPEDNPFVGVDGIDEIWASGLRNPFSFSFERGTTNLYLADVGQNRVEEIDIIVRGGNYGWNIKEGTFWFDGAGRLVSAPVRPVPAGLIDPIAQYDHDDGLAVLAGYVYHGMSIPALEGRFVFGDWGSFAAPSGRLFYLDETNGVNELRIGLEDRPLGLWLRGYGQDAEGELYIFCSRQLGPSGTTGRVLKLVPPPAQPNMAGMTPNGTNVVVSWTGGAGPVALQKKSNLADPIWANAAFAAGTQATVPASGTAGFFRAFDAAHVPPIPFTAHLTGGAERPTPNDSTATGSGIFALDGNSLYFSIRYSGLSAQATAAHIHGPASAAEFAGVIIDLAPFNGGAWGTNGTLSGVIVLTDEHKALLMQGRTYVNVHNSLFPSGEIRGQIAPVNLEIALSGARENPAIPTAGNGLGNLTLVGNQLTFNVTYSGLSGPALAAHIHGPATEQQNTNVLVDLAPFNGGSFGPRGSLSGTVTLNPTQLAYVIDGLTYINFHTTQNPGGEVRGQIVPKSTAVPFTALMSGLAEHPALTNSATGSGTFSLEGDTLTFNVTYSGLSGSATAAHIHGYTNTTRNAGVIIDLAPYNGGVFGTSGTLSGTRKVTPAQRLGILSGLTYVNVHTTANPGGELRGQIAPVSMFSSLSGGNEGFAGVDSPGTGLGAFALVRDRLALNLSYRDLLSPATASHIHGPASLFQSTNVVHDLAPYNGGSYGSSGNLSGAAMLPYNVLLYVVDGLTYINFHTTNYPGGEIRGQIMR